MSGSLPLEAPFAISAAIPVPRLRKFRRFKIELLIGATMLPEFYLSPQIFSWFSLPPDATDCSSITQYAMGILSEVTVYIFGIDLENFAPLIFVIPTFEKKRRN